DLDRLTVRVADQMLDVLHPAVAAVAFPEAVLDRVAAGPIEAGRLRLDRGEIVGMHPLAPELGILEVFGGGVPEELGDVGADEGRRVIPARLVAVDHRGRAGEELRQARVGSLARQLRGLPRADVAPRADDLRRLAV